MKENSVWLYLKVICVLAHLYIAAAIVYCLPWRFVIRPLALKPIGGRVNEEVLEKNGAHAESA